MPLSQCQDSVLLHWILRAFPFHSLLYKCKSLLHLHCFLHCFWLRNGLINPWTGAWFRPWVRFQGLHLPPRVLLTFPESWSRGIPEHLTAAAHLHLLRWKFFHTIAPRFAGFLPVFQSFLLHLYFISWSHMCPGSPVYLFSFSGNNSFNVPSQHKVKHGPSQGVLG